MLGRIELLYIFLVCLLPLQLSSQSDTISIYYATDKFHLGSQDPMKIDSFLTLYDHESIQSIELIGLADHRGSIAYNLLLSDRRAKSVRDHIISQFPALTSTIQQNAKGEIDGSSILFVDRRVDIILTRQHSVSRLDGAFTPANIPVEKLEAGNVLSIEGLNFHDRRSVLLPKSIPHLKDLEEVLKTNPNIEVEIQGHVCCPDHQKNGGDGFNKDTNESNLSLTRAKNIYDYLVRKGIASSRLKYKGLGASNPLIYPEETEQDRTKNRRVELLITKI